jgi:hypothetical protein
VINHKLYSCCGVSVWPIAVLTSLIKMWNYGTILELLGKLVNFAVRNSVQHYQRLFANIINLFIN